ncbi:hypothetical protein BGZ63DRAFT_116407 [Mariannaea sp. PMI_226]|nr:hypothetical protein BGZ63DRAFT_116407 [Mariannaea sp. PMI_226]
MEATMVPTAMSQPAFYYYNSDSKNEVRQHFGPQQAVRQQMMFPMVPTLPSTPVYSRPGSASSHPPTLYSNGPAVVTPTASPQPIALNKSAMMLETEFYENSYFPSTPPLSTSGSSIGSPNTCEILQTPMNPMFSGLDGVDGLKDGLELVETSVLDWSSCGSPPMTPVYLQSQLGKVPSLSNTPSLSPSPAPYARSVSTPDQDVDFCDPRNLTVSVGAAATIAPEFVTLGEEVKVEQVKAVSTNAQASFDFNPSLPSGLDFSDLESEDDFVNTLFHLTGDSTVTDAGRPRACTGSSVVSLGHGSFIGDDELSFEENDSFNFPGLPSPATSSTEDLHKDKRVKPNNCCNEVPVVPMMNVAASSTHTAEAEESSTSPAAEHSDSGASSCSEATPSSLPAPANRRGRKQSLTEDPSKTFVCDLCNRRFRRQEHLKRHYRSLHTQEKPFECNECGKKFSRSDNLAQHARTHGSGAIVMNLIDDPEGRGFDPSMIPQPAADDYNAYGKVLFQIAAEVPGSASEVSSDEGSDQGKKKRKRSD